jgi:Right handed beta helix region
LFVAKVVAGGASPDTPLRSIIAALMGATRRFAPGSPNWSPERGSMTLKELACAAFVAAGSVAAFADTPAPTPNATTPDSGPSAATPDPGPSADSYVSAAGSDDNFCTISKPCLTIGHAIARTIKEGTVHCLDSFGNAALSITQSITIDCSNTTARVAGISIDGSNLSVYLIGLELVGQGTGIKFNTGAAVFVKNCKFYMLASAIYVGSELTPNSGPIQLYVADTDITESTHALFLLPAETNVTATFINVNITNNGDDLLIAPAAGSVTATFQNVRITQNRGGGIKTDSTHGPVIVDIADSVISANAGNGVSAVSDGTRNNTISISRSIISANGSAGVQANGASSQVLIDTTSLDNNAAGAISATGSARVLTYHTNRIVGAAGTGFNGSAPLQ